MVSQYDGRTMRRTRNRAAVITALLSLIREGDLEPNADAVSERAGVSARSLFRYFDDLADLLATAIAQDLEAAQPLTVIPRLGEGPLEDRISRLVDSRLALFEQVGTTVKVANFRASSVPAIAVVLGEFRAPLRPQLAEHFSMELSKMSSADSTSIIDAIVAITGSESYYLHRQGRERSIERTKYSWNTSLVALLQN